VPHYVFESDEGGNIVRILKDGQPHDQSVHLEQLYSIVTIYFRLASEHLARMASLQERNARRCAGLQSFLMGLTGLEAFTNTFFQLRAQELGSEEMIARIAPRRMPLKRIAKRRISANASDPRFRASTFLACRSVSRPRGLMHSAAATTGEIA